MPGEVVAIYIASKAEELPHSVERVRVLPGHGLDGDRYAKGIGTFSSHKGQRDVSLIESGSDRSFRARVGHIADRRRKSGVTFLRVVFGLNDLVGKEFNVGKIRMRGLRLCEPCTHLVRLTHPATLRGLVHRGGLYAAILNEGEIAVGDSIDGFGAQPITFARAIGTGATARAARSAAKDQTNPERNENASVAKEATRGTTRRECGRTGGDQGQGASR